MSILSFFFGRGTKRVAGPEQLTGIEPSPADERDVLYAVGSGPMDTTVASVDMSMWCPPVKQQGNIGSCGSHAFATAMELLANKDNNYVPLSERFHYYETRKAMGTFPQDSGQFLRDGAKVAQKQGIAPERLCAYNVHKYNDEPNMFAYGFSRFFKLNSYHRCYNHTQMRNALESGSPVVFGIYVQSSIFTTSTSGDVEGTGKSAGGHALLAVGYDDNHANPDGTTGAIRFINSWGPAWGDNGYGWISYTLLNKHLIEAWAVQ
jgi:C1A family cysteine protease